MQSQLSVDSPTCTPSTKHLDWIEKAATENLRAHLATSELLLNQANQLLNILLAGMAGAMAYGVKIFESDATPLAYGVATLAAWLAVGSVVVVAKCITTRETQMLFNEPQNLLLGASVRISELKRLELLNMQTRIDHTKIRNRLVAKWLDRCRYSAALSPLAFSAGAWIAS